MIKPFGNKLVDEGFEIKLFAPALDLDQIEIHAYSSKLTIFIPENEIFEETKQDWVMRPELDILNTKASLDRGILTIIVPYHKDKAPKKIDITKI